MPISPAVNVIFRRFALRMLLAALVWAAMPVMAADVEVPSGSTISVQVFGSGRDRLLWLPGEFSGRAAAQQTLGRGLAGAGYQVWFARLHDSYFLTPGRESLDAVPREDIAALIERARPKHGRLFLLSFSRGAALTLEAARLWQLAHPGVTGIAGVVLLHPNLFAGVAMAGQTARYLPITEASNLPIYIFQPGESARRWYLSDLARRLAVGGSTVYSRLLPGVGDGFALRPQASERESALRRSLPDMVRQALEMLMQSAGGARVPVAELPPGRLNGGGGLADGLRPIAGAPPAPALALSDTAGQRLDLSSLRGKVVLVNFWATWCPPCVHEIPSLGRLRRRLTGRGFSVVSVEVGGKPAQVAAFLNKVPADYPVLLDSTGSLVEPWHLQAFPTSFLIDREGRIRYGYFGALDWDAPPVRRLIGRLLADSTQFERTE